MKVFSIVVIYNGMKKNWIKKCFDSLQGSTFASTIIAVDNGSADESVSFIKENYPDVILIESKTNLGFGKANNLGFELALKNNADFVFLLNQDAQTEKDTLDCLVKAAIKNPGYEIVSPIHLNGDGSQLDFNFSNYIIPKYCKNLYSDYVLNKVEDKIYESDFICAAAWLISRKCLETVGGFSPTFYHYAEDNNYIHRLHYKNLKIGVYPFTKIFHDRERRTNNLHLDDDEKVITRSLLLTYSNPLLKKDLNKEKRRLQKTRIKSFLLNQQDAVKYASKRIAIINKCKNIITMNLRISKEDHKYPFLQTKNDEQQT